MFSKQTRSETSSFTADLPALVDAPPQSTSPRKGSSPKVASLVSDDIAIEGNLRGDGELHVDGHIRGDVVVARLTIGENGCIEGAIHAEVVEARGRVIGSITAKQVRLFASCYVDGDITHEQLTMEAGAYFQGRSLKFQRPPATVATVGGDVIDISAAS